jgi:hypothetical protein
MDQEDPIYEDGQGQSSTSASAVAFPVLSNNDLQRVADVSERDLHRTSV